MSTLCETVELPLYVALNDTKELEALQQVTLLSEYEHIVIHTIFVISYICTFILNLGVIISIRYRKALQSPMNYLLLNLSFGHIISGANNLLYTFPTDTGTLSTSRTTRNNLCALTEGDSIYYIGSGTYLLTLCAISFNRYMAIKYPTKQHLRMSKNVVICFNVLVWIVSTAWILPSDISWKYNDLLKVCLRDWKYIRYSMVYRILLLAWSVILPFSFLILSFSAIVWKRKEKNLLFIFDNNSAIIRKLRLQKAERLLGLLIITFFVSWSPFFIYWSLYTAGLFKGCRGELESNKWARIATLVSTCNGIIDPLLVANGSKEFKRTMDGFYKKLIGQTNNRIGDSRSLTNTIGRIATLSSLGVVQTTLTSEL